MNRETEKDTNIKLEIVYCVSGMIKCHIFTCDHGIDAVKPLSIDKLFWISVIRNPPDKILFVTQLLNYNIWTLKFMMLAVPMLTLAFL